jgi:hypothetical protein
MVKADFMLGHEPMGSRVNIREELKRLREDPLGPLLQRLGAAQFRILSDDRTRYQDAYWFYYLSLDRYLREMSVAARYSKGAYWVRKAGGKQGYTPSQRKIAAEYNRIAPFLEYDLVNCLIHARILLDRVASLARTFITGKNLPSFTSFNDHKRFFTRLTTPYGDHEAYAKYIRERTDWFDMPLKAVRDQFVVHASPRHMRFLGYPNGGYELDLTIILPDSDDPEKPLAKVKVISVNALRLSADIKEFLQWFCKYGLAVLPDNGRRSSR